MPDRLRRLPLVAGLAVVAGLSVLDAAWGPEGIITVTVLLGPLVVGLLAPPRDVAIVGIAAVTAAALSATWNDNFGDGPYWLRLLVVAVGAVVAVAGARQRVRAQDSRRRFRLLVALADVGEGALTLDETVEALTGILVPEFADVCIVDLLLGDEPVRLAVKATGTDAEAVETWLRGRPPAEADVEISSRTTARTRRAHVVPEIDTDAVAAWSLDPDDERRMRALAARSSMTIPLLARGRILGTLSLTVTDRSGRRYAEADAAFGEVLAGRVALALDNAGLYAELQTAEAQLSASLESLADAVLVEAPGERLVHANPAAVRQLGFASAQELLERRPGEVLDRFELFGEDRQPLTGAEVLAAGRVFAGELPEPVLVRHVERATREEGWSVVKSTPVAGREGHPHLAVHVIEDVTALKRAEDGQRLLVLAGRALTSSMDFARTLQEVADLVVPALADWCTIALPDGTGHLRQVAVAHVDPERVRFAQELDERHPPRLNGASNPAGVMRDGGSRCVNGITPEQLRRSAHDDEHYRLLSELGLYAGLAVPLVATGEPLGVMTLASAESRRRFSDADVLLAEQLGRQAGTAVHTGRLYAERSSIAATLQAGLLPPDLPPIPGWATVPLYRPAGEETWVGGDFYDAFAVRGGWMIIVGDVAGRGAPAAALTALARHTLRTAGRLLDDPAGALRELNRELYARGGGALCTLVCVLLSDDPAAREVEVICAGHPQPVLLRDGEPRQVGHFGTIVGAFPTETWTAERVEMAPGDTLVLYTDGVIDTVGETGRFGEQRLLDALAGTGSAREAVERIERSIGDFERGPQADDTAALALARTERVRAPAPPRRRRRAHDAGAPGSGRGHPLPESLIDVPRGPEGPGVARQEVRALLGATLPGERIEVLELVVSELVTNAVRHGEGAIRMRLQRENGVIRGEVIDQGAGFQPVLQERGPDELGGRGLWLVSLLARRWGVHEGASRVWFELDARSPEEAAATDSEPRETRRPRR